MSNGLTAYPQTPQYMKLRDWRRRYATVDRKSFELFSWAFWHRRLYTTAATTLLDFFDGVATDNAGNLPLGSQLPANSWFLIRAIRICPVLNTSESVVAAPAAGVTETVMENATRFVGNSWAEFSIGGKPYGSWPTLMLPAGGGAYGGIAIAGGANANPAQYSWAGNGPPDPRAVYSLPVPLTIPPNYHMRLRVQWGAAVTFQSAVSPDVIAILDGELMRPRQ